jgi:PAS domain S-box-containing protein
MPGETGYFLNDEIDLMVTIAGNLSFALEALEEEQQRKRAEAEVLRQRTELQLLFDLMPAFIWFVDTQNRILRINRHAAIVAGKQVAEIECRPLSEIYTPDVARLFAADAQLLHSGTPKLGIIDKMRDQDGKELWLQTDKVPYRDTEGNIVGAVVMSHDITERNRLERRFRRLADSDVQGVIFWTKQGEIIGGNDAFLRLVGYSREDLEAGRINWTAMTPTEYAAADQRALASVVATGICAPYEKEFFRKDGSRVAILIGSAIFEDTPDEGVSFVLDLTARRELEQQLRQAQKMEAVGQLTGGVAHDFNNLLGIIRLNLELIMERLRDDPQADEMAMAALKAADRGASLTHKLLAYARQQPLEPSTVNVASLLSEMTTLLNRTLGESIEIKTVIPADLWTTMIDPHQLENALLNLAVNAFHAMPDGGKLIIEASNKLFDELYVSLNPDVLPGAYVLIAVTDTGTGMSAEIIECALEPFFTTKPVGKGSGLGLSMVHGFAKQSGGHLKIYSEPGHGTTINLYLPRSSVDAETKMPVAPKQEPAATRSEYVFVVEDDEFLRGPTVKVLGNLGYRTFEAEDGPSALLLLDQIEHIDLLLTDVVLPKGMFGPELAQRVRARWPDVKVLYMSGYPRDAVLHKGVLDSRAYLLSKPFAKAELAAMVRRVLDEGDAT